MKILLVHEHTQPLLPEFNHGLGKVISMGASALSKNNNTVYIACSSDSTYVDPSAKVLRWSLSSKVTYDQANVPFPRSGFHIISNEISNMIKENEIDHVIILSQSSGMINALSKIDIPRWVLVFSYPGFGITSQALSETYLNFVERGGFTIAVSKYIKTIFDGFLPGSVSNYIHWHYIEEPQIAKPAEDYVITISRVDPFKDVHLAAKAMVGCKYKGIFVGPRPVHQQNMDYANNVISLFDGEKVKYIPKMDNKELLDLIGGAVCLIESCNVSASSTVSFEAASRGVPVVTLVNNVPHGGVETIEDLDPYLINTYRLRENKRVELLINTINNVNWSLGKRQAIADKCAEIYSFDNFIKEYNRVFDECHYKR